MAERKKRLSENLEDYLEAISFLSSGKTDGVRLTDIANAMSVKKPSATAALISLSERGLVEYEKYKPVALTAAGELIAKNVRKKHVLLSGFFKEVLGVCPEEADIAACKMEHALEDNIMEKLIGFLKGANFNACSTCLSKAAGCESDCPHSICLSELAAGDRAVVLDVQTEKNQTKSVELSVGTIVQVDKITACSFSLKTFGRKMSLSKSAAKRISVKRI